MKTENRKVVILEKDDIKVLNKSYQSLDTLKDIVYDNIKNKEIISKAIEAIEDVKLLLFTYLTELEKS